MYTRKSKRYEIPKLNKDIYTNSHQVWLKTENFNNFTQDCADINVSVYRSFIPTFEDYGMRIGVQEVTYLGLVESDMILLAKAIILANKENKKSEAKKIIENLLIKTI